jgi:Ca-activated chloride channel family protein
LASGGVARGVGGTLALESTREAYTSLNAFDEMPRSWRQRLHLLPTVVYSLAVVCLVAALARPQLENVTVEQKTEGIDIVISMDISSSMRAEDLKPNRLEAARQVALDFVDGRLSDRIGMVVFARQSYTACPPTLDYTLLNNVITELKMGQRYGLGHRSESLER